MKKLFMIKPVVSFLVLLMAAMNVSAQEVVPIDEEHFPDAGFRRWLTKYVSPEKIATVSRCVIRDNTSYEHYDIKSIEGIEYFSSLEKLEIYSCDISSIDVSLNTKLRTLVLSKCPNLTSFSLNGHSCLEDMRIADCEKMSFIHITDNERLQTLYLGRINQIQDVDLKGNTALTSLKIYLPDNYPEKSVDLSGLANLEFLDFANFSELDVSKNTKLRHIQTTNAPTLTAIDVTNNVNLESLFLFRNDELSSLDVRSNLKLKDLRLRMPKLDYLDVGNNVDLETLLVIKGRISAIDISANEKLTFLRLDSLDLLTNVDVSNNRQLKQFYCANNNIKALDLSNNSELTYLNCRGNRLTNLNLSNNPKVDEVLCYDNQIGEEAMSELISSLSQTYGKLYVVCSGEKDGNVFTMDHYNQLKNKYWKSYYMTLVWKPYRGCYEYSGSEITDAYWPTGINAIKQYGQESQIFDLMGRKMKQPMKGLYIINSRKIVVTK